jgi:hypothetical protein
MACLDVKSGTNMGTCKHVITKMAEDVVFACYLCKKKEICKLDGWMQHVVCLHDFLTHDIKTCNK